MESHQDVNANFVYEAIHSRVPFVSSLLQCALSNYADSPAVCATTLPEYISNVVECNFKVTTCC